MKITFISNYFNHHQKQFCENMFKSLKEDFIFIQTMPIEEERINMGWREELPSYVRTVYNSDDSKKDCLELINCSDVVIMGDAPFEFINDRIKKDKLTFFYYERIFKKGFYRILYPPTLYKVIKKIYIPSKNRNTYLLCASAYTAYDVKRAFSYIGKTFKWGYFPELKSYEIDDLMMLKNNEIIKLLYVGRMIDCKHIEHTIQLANKLKKNGYKFKLNIIGSGKLENKLKMMVKKYELDDNISFLGTMSPDQVRKYMEESNIYLFTSDFREGWGAVLNEAMNSGCAVVASHAIGSAPFLIKDGYNGLIYKYGDINELYFKVKKLLDNKILQEQIGRNSYFTINNIWNANIASERFIKISKALLNNTDIEFNNGPCSKAKIIKNNWIEEK